MHFVVAASPRKIFNNEIIFSSFFAEVKTEVITFITTNQRVIKGVAFAVTLFIRPSGVWKLESKCMSCVRESCNERNQYAVVVVKNGVVVVGLLPEAVSRDLLIVST